MNKKIKILFIIGILVLISLNFGTKDYLLNFTAKISNLSYNSFIYVRNLISEHFNQVYEIQTLRKQNQELEYSAQLLNTFATKLNEILKDSNSTKFSPKISRIKTLNYQKIGIYDKFYVDFRDFNKSKIYGLINQGNSAGILIESEDKPLAILQSSSDCVFAVYIGDERIPGVATGNGKNLIVNLIPRYLEPKIGDIVYTSGNDGIFFAGVPVGKIEKISDDNLYKSAEILPFNEANLPAFLYVITKEN